MNYTSAIIYYLLVCTTLESNFGVIVLGKMFHFFVLGLKNCLFETLMHGGRFN